MSKQLSSSVSEYLRQEQAAELTNFSGQTLANWRSQRVGPPFTKVGRAVRYKRTDLEAWLESQRVQPDAN